jgi:hypothetical protein
MHHGDFTNKELVEAYRARRAEYRQFGYEDHPEARKIRVWLAENDKPAVEAARNSVPS